LATKIRLKRLGGKHEPHYRIVIADSKKRRDGSAVEELGYYSPAGEETTLDVNVERVEHWLEIGAQPTETVRSLLVKAGVLEGAAGEEAEGEAEVEAAPEEVEAAPEEVEAAPEEAEAAPEEAEAGEEAAQTEEALEAEEAQEQVEEAEEAPETE
jgi:small subunit ribosomal protein S16